MSQSKVSERPLVFIAAVVLFCLGLVVEMLRQPGFSFALSPRSEIKIIHKAPETSQIPQPATLMTLSLELENSKSTELKIRLIASRDGKLLDVALAPGFFNDQERPVYQIKIPAPTAFLTYQFVVHDPNGSLTTSARYVVQRPCIPELVAFVPKGDPDASFRTEIGELIVKAKQLERDTLNYDTSIELLTDLKSLVKE